MGEPKPRPILHRAGPRPLAVRWAAQVATANLLGGILLTFWVQHLQAATRPLAFIPPQIPFMLLWLLVIRMFFRGRNWARVVYIVATAIGAVTSFRQLVQLDTIFVELLMVFTIARCIDAIAIGLLLSPPSNDWFKRPLVPRPGHGAA